DLLEIADLTPEERALLAEFGL
ncbi:MAG: hypothetical protein RLY23_271, partial [Actinomycetota bacterium]